MKTFMVMLMLCIGLGTLCAQTSQENKPKYYQKGEKMLSITPLWNWTNPIRNTSGQVIGGGLSLGADVAFGRFVKDQWMFGTRLSYRTLINFETPPPAHHFGWQTFTRYYFGQGRITTFVEGGLGLTDNYQTPTREHIIESYGYGRVGLAFRPGKRMSLEVAAEYRRNFGTNGLRQHSLAPVMGINFHF